MGKLIDGQWVKGSIITSDKEGAYDRLPRTFRDFISDDHPVFKPESGRYHLYVSYACPWAHRTLIYRKLKGLDEHISFDVVSPDMLEEGWVFDETFPGATTDSLFSSRYLREIYQRADSQITTSVTVPILWDKKTNTIVNNESSEIIRMFNTSFNKLTANSDDYYPDDLSAEIDALNEVIYHSVNNGVYKTGFAKNQQSYEAAATALFIALDDLEARLSKGQYLLGDRITEADLRLIPTLLRFDIVYFTHFKCNLRQIKEYPNLRRYTNALFSLEAIKTTTNFDHIKRHYYYSHEKINPYRIVPVGPSEFL